jgi:hypothetical protein
LTASGQRDPGQVGDGAVNDGRGYRRVAREAGTHPRKAGFRQHRRHAGSKARQRVDRRGAEWFVGENDDESGRVAGGREQDAQLGRQRLVTRADDPDHARHAFERRAQPCEAFPLGRDPVALHQQDRRRQDAVREPAGGRYRRRAHLVVPRKRGHERHTDRTGMGAAVGGGLLLGAVLSLPGIGTTVVGSLQGDAEFALANPIGGIAIQTVWLAIGNLLYRRVNIEHAAASLENIMQALVLVALLCIPVMSYATRRCGWDGCTR